MTRGLVVISIFLVWLAGPSICLPSESPPVQISVPTVSAARGEVESTELTILTSERHDSVLLRFTDLRSPTATVSASVIDAKVIVAWYQSEHADTDVRRNDKDGRRKFDSLLLHDEKMLMTDDVHQRNLLRVATGRNGEFSYRDISPDLAEAPAERMRSKQYQFDDAPSLQEFALQASNLKRLWVTIDVPDSARPGDYTSNISVVDVPTGVVLGFSTLRVHIYPFTLAAPRLEYSLYYRGILGTEGSEYITSEEKSPSQMRFELMNMRRFGVDNPTVYQPISDPKRFEEVLSLRSAAGMSNRRIYYLGLTTSRYDDAEYWKRMLGALADLWPMLRRHGVSELYLYGIDEAEAHDIESQYPLWATLRRAGYKIFAANWKRDLVPKLEGHVDQLNCQATLTTDDIARLQAAGTRVYLYGQPQVGVQNPALYRLHYGINLWRTGYDGEMDYAYQHEAGSIWNDFDDSVYRDHVFAYPTSNGLVETLPWHFFRQGINDVRYIATLEKRVNELQESSDDISMREARRGRAYLSILKAIDPVDPYSVRRFIASFLESTDAYVPRRH